MDEGKIAQVGRALAVQRFLRQLPPHQRSKIQWVSLTTMPDDESLEDAKAAIEAADEWEAERKRFLMAK
jgi:hypothetical protein